MVDRNAEANLERLWSPWRIEWIESDPPVDGECPFCVTREAAQKLPGLIVATSEFSYATLNLYPYNGGHIMILPYRHVGDITDLLPEEQSELFANLQSGVAALRSAMTPSGFNIGLNLGTAAGAGVPGHVHFHVVPRWSGDANFMPVVGQTKVIPESLEQTKLRIVEAWPR